MRRIVILTVLLLAMTPASVGAPSDATLLETSFDGPGWVMMRFDGLHADATVQLSVEMRTHHASLSFLSYDANGSFAGAGWTFKPDSEPTYYGSASATGMRISDPQSAEWTEAPFHFEYTTDTFCPCDVESYLWLVIAAGDIASWSITVEGAPGSILSHTQGDRAFEVELHRGKSVVSAGAFGNDLQVGFEHTEVVEDTLLAVVYANAGARLPHLRWGVPAGTAPLADVVTPTGTKPCPCWFDGAQNDHGAGEYTFRLTGETYQWTLVGADVKIPA